VFDGTFEEYLERPQPPTKAPPPARGEQQEQPAKQPAAVAAKLTYKQQMARANLEREIEAKEAALAQLVEQIHDASARADARALADLGHQHEELKAQIDALMDEWAMLG